MAVRRCSSTRGKCGVGRSVTRDLAILPNEPVAGAACGTQRRGPLPPEARTAAEGGPPDEPAPRDGLRRRSQASRQMSAFSSGAYRPEPVFWADERPLMPMSRRPPPHCLSSARWLALLADSTLTDVAWGSRPLPRHLSPDDARRGWTARASGTACQTSASSRRSPSRWPGSAVQGGPVAVLSSAPLSLPIAAWRVGNNRRFSRRAKEVRALDQRAAKCRR